MPQQSLAAEAAQDTTEGHPSVKKTGLCWSHVSKAVWYFFTLAKYFWVKKTINFFKKKNIVSMSKSHNLVPLTKLVSTWRQALGITSKTPRL